VKIVIAALTGLIAAVQLSLAADVPPRIPALDTVMQDFAKQNGVAYANLAVVHDGRLVHDGGYGRSDKDEPIMIGSLSKAITGACVALLVQQGRLHLDTRLGDLLAGYFKDYGNPRDSDVLSVTVRNLLIHRSGFENNGANDPMVKAMVTLLNKKPIAEISLAEFMKEIYGYSLIRKQGVSYDYSNVDYLTLSLVIESVTGRGYDDYCREMVLAPLGAGRAKLHPVWGVMNSGTGGWSMTAADYLAFSGFFERTGPLQPDMRGFFLEARDSDMGKNRPRDRYTLGMVVHTEDNGRASWNHNGSYTWDGGGIPGRSLSNKDIAGVSLALVTRTWFYRLNNNDRYALFIDGGPQGSVMSNARKKIEVVLSATKEWPAEDGFVALGLR
jgi:CubicO group peptidase (beta-lactamase class C family)